MEDRYILHDLQFSKKHPLRTYNMTSADDDFVYSELKRGQGFGAVQTPSHLLLIFLEGSCILDYEHFADRDFTTGQMVLIHRNSYYAGLATSDMKILIMPFETPVGEYDIQILQTCHIDCSEIIYNFQPTPIHYPLTDFFNLLVYCIKEGISSRFFLEWKRQELFFYLMSFYTKSEVAYLFYEVMGHSLKFRKFIYDHYMEVDTLNELIELSNMSRSVFFRKFKEEFKETAYQWMLKHKCRQILRYLNRPDITIKEVVDKFKFSSFSNFNRFCKINYGCSPKQLMERIRLDKVSEGG